MGLAMCLDKLLLDTLDNMVLKSAFDYLVEEIRTDHFMDVSSRKMCCEHLRSTYVISKMKLNKHSTNLNIVNDTIVVP